MKKEENFCPNVQQLDEQAEELLSFIAKYNKEVEKTKLHLKNAIIDLTEVPLMHPQMQRLAIHTAVKMACKNIDKFCRETYT